MKMFFIIVFLIFSLIGYFVETNFQIGIGIVLLFIYLCFLKTADEFGNLFVHLFFIVFIFFPIGFGNVLNYLINEKGFELIHFLR